MKEQEIIRCTSLCTHNLTDLKMQHLAEEQAYFQVFVVDCGLGVTQSSYIIALN